MNTYAAPSNGSFNHRLCHAQEDGDESELEDLDLEELERDIQLGGQIGECKFIFAQRPLLLIQEELHGNISHLYQVSHCVSAV